VAQPDFILPDFIEDSDVDDIQERMMDNLPEDISKMEGDFPYDFTMPTAIEISQFLQFSLAQCLMLAFPEGAWDEWLDMHAAQANGLTRKAASYATGEIQVTAEEGTVIEEGTVFAVPETDNNEVVEFESTAEVEFLEDGTLTIPIKAVDAGADGNVAAGTITIMDDPVDGVEEITNESPTTGGTDEESDDELYDRIAAENSSAKTYVGNDSDYIKWALSVDGIGGCIVNQAYDGPGTVQLVLTDSNGDPASSDLCEAVYNYIVSPNDRSARLLPTGSAYLSVTSATTRAIAFTAAGLELSDTTLDTVVATFSENIEAVFDAAKDDNILRYNSARTVLANIDGVVDFESFTMAGGETNITLDSAEFATLGTVTFAEKSSS